MPLTSIAEFLDPANNHTPTTAERNLIAAVRAGRNCILNGGTPPTAPSDATQIRADLLRLLILGGTTNCGLHESGVSLSGGYITDTLDLSFNQARRQCALDACQFVEEPRFTQAELLALSLDNSQLPGLSAQGLKTTGGLFLRNLTASGSIDLIGAQIGGAMECIGAELKCADGAALNAQNISIGANLFLKDLTAVGTIAVNGAQIGGQLVCNGVKLDGKGRAALNAQRLHVEQGFLWQSVKSVKGSVNLFAAHIGDLTDEAASWCAVNGDVILDGFTYDRIAPNSPGTELARRDWLAQGSTVGHTFTPQPYTQFAKVLREMGHASEARKVLVERESRLFEAAHAANLAALKDTRFSDICGFAKASWRYYMLRFWAWFTRTFSGYGHAPQYALFWSLGFVAFGTVWFFIAWRAGVMVPNSDVILTSGEWTKAMALNHDAPTPAWGAMNAATHYETFYSLPYALDVFVPLVSMGQENAWSASTVGWFGWATRIFTFVYQIAGWAITALGVASITGFVQKNQPD